MTTLIAFDSDVLIYAASPGHPLGQPVTRLFTGPSPVGIGSVLLLPEILTKPTRGNSDTELRALASLLSRLTLLPFNEPTARLGLTLGQSTDFAQLIRLTWPPPSKPEPTCS